MIGFSLYSEPSYLIICSINLDLPDNKISYEKDKVICRMSLFGGLLSYIDWILLIKYYDIRNLV
jgi:hypothetical protein